MKLTGILAAAATAIALTAGVAHAEGLGGITEFRIGILGGENEADRLRSNECLKGRLEKLLGVPVSLFPAADYAGVIEGLKGGTLDYAELGASGYAAVWLENPDAVEPVLTSQQIDGSTGYYSIMVSRADSGIKTLKDMKGKKLGYADPNSTSGFLVPSVAFDEQGIDADKYFASTGFMGGHEQNVLAVVSGDVDGGVTWSSGVGEWEEGYSNGNLRKMVDKGILDMNDLNEVWRSPLIPNGPLVLRKALPDVVKMAVIGSMSRLVVEDKDCFYKVVAGDSKGLVPVTHEFYKTIVEARRRKIEKKN